MIARSLLVAALVWAPAATPDGSAEAGYVDASLAFEGELLGYEFVDVDARGPRELVAVVLAKGGRRTLQVHRLGARGYDAQPEHVVEVLEDVIAYGFADVRSEAGRELLMLTRSGAYSYSLTKDGYRGNIERLVEAPLLFDVPNPRALPYWPYVLEMRGGGDRILLPEREGFALFAPRPTTDEIGADEPHYRRTVVFAPIEGAATDVGGGPATRERGRRGGEVSIGLGFGAASPLLDEPDDRGGLLRDAKGYAAPALADVDGDGTVDIVRLVNNGLAVHLGRDGRWRQEPDRVEALPDYLDVAEEDESLLLRIEELDGDGRPDLLATIERSGEGFADADVRVLLLVNDGRRMLPDAPSQVLRFSAATLPIDVADANADGRPDLMIRKFNLPSLVDTVTGLEFTLSHLLFLGERARGRVVERSPVLRQSQTFDENAVSEVIKGRVFAHDCSGDGRVDLVEADLSGRIAIRRLKFDSGFFSGDTWELETSPWKRFERRGDALDLRVEDLNGDGLGDIASRGDAGLTLLMSRRGR